MFLLDAIPVDPGDILMEGITESPGPFASILGIAIIIIIGIIVIKKRR